VSGIYIHIPFCKKACHYCDFHFSTNLNLKKDMALAIANEIGLQKNYLKSKNIETIYFGGGTPSLLNEEEFEIIFKAIYKNFIIDIDAEITLEANPDDLSKEKLNILKKYPFNRLSIGVQSFYEPHLKFMNRAHTSSEAYSSVINAQNAGFDNITIDLIYSVPHHDHSIWENDLQKAVELNIQHISAYSLTIEPKTVFGKQLKNGKITPIDEEFSAKQFEILVEYLSENNFDQYEISNFCLPDKYARHNSNYWKRKNYLGLGPSAHSFNGETRQWNVSNNKEYINSIKNNLLPFTIEHLSTTDQINEYLLTSLRTKWGTDINEIEKISGINFYKKNQIVIENYIISDHLTLNNNIITLTQKGKLLADEITLQLYIEK